MDAILLAAGNSSRFGENKMLYEVDGEPMVLSAVRRLLTLRDEDRSGTPLLEEMTLVTQYDAVISLLQKEGCDIDIVRNEHPEEGISLSLRLGLAHLLEKKPHSRACLFSVCDQPYLQAETVAKLIARFEASDCGIAALASEEGVLDNDGAYPDNAHNDKEDSIPSDGKSIGNPVIFSSKYYNELDALRGDRGGKRVLMRHLDDTVLLPVSARELLDLDYRPASGRLVESENASKKCI